ncbi:MAG TPA: potassium-transporting ATPase subunit KdpA, partial [Stellaceae bacterium]|nr:potassium-transporting ATPase subunit KdpA [Stellaceae bacterium]
MTVNGWVQIGILAVIVLALARPLGGYMTAVFEGRMRFLRPVERGIYALCGVDDGQEQHWLAYGLGMLLFHAAGFLLLYAMQRLQYYLPFNPMGQTGVSPDSAFNTSVSFDTNTNWQSYTPESTMGYLVQMAGLTVHNFVSAAAGIVLSVVLIRGFARRSAQTIGNFWVDMTRCVLYILLPLSILGALVLVWQGVPQNLGAYTEVTTLEGVKQIIAQGPVAS